MSTVVSIVCTNYNKGQWIAEAIESFLRQNIDFAYEILIIDDGSSDESPTIIRDYAKQYPDVIRAVYNKKNLGITKTWIKICKQAKGKYIARCDGDDYWIDNNKLQKQVELLARNTTSKWCSTDYDIITPEGVVVHRSAFESGLVDRSTSYAELLATKGFTMSSTWLVETELMCEINAEISESAVDDTFNIQLELFNKTELTYLPEATAAYRINEGSDSRPVELEKIKARNERLLQTQLEYIEKFKNVDYNEILKILLERGMKSELLAIERLQLVHQQRDHISQQESTIKTLQKAITDITTSLKYRLIRRGVEIARQLFGLPMKMVRKLLWLDGRRRYKRYHKKTTPTAEQLVVETENARNFTYKPKISIIVPTYNTPENFFQKMLESVMSQTYPYWELVLVDDASQNKDVREYIKNAAKSDRRIVYTFLKKNQHIAGATNEGIHRASGDFISLLDHDDVLHPSTLYEIAKMLQTNRSLDVIYTDEDKIDERGQHFDPFLKPDWNQEFLYSVNYMTHFTTIRKSVVEKIGGERSEYNGAQDWDLYLRATHAVKPEAICHIPKILYSWRMHEGSTAKNIDTKPYVFEAHRKLLEDAMRQRGLRDDQFSVQKSARMNGAWEVSYDGQKTENLHMSGEPVDYSRIQGLAMSGAEIVRNVGYQSIVSRYYRDCRYTIQKDDAEGDNA